MSRYARKKDANHAEIVAVFESLGCSVLVLDVSAKGAPDLLVGRNGADQLVEVKPVSGVKAVTMPRPGQVAFAERWKGRWVDVVRTAEDAAVVANGLGLR